MSQSITKNDIKQALTARLIALNVVGNAPVRDWISLILLLKIEISDT